MARIISRISFIMLVILLCYIKLPVSATFDGKLRWTLLEKTAHPRGRARVTPAVAARVYPQAQSSGDGDDIDNIFRAFWNVPNYCGVKYGISLPLDDYGIEYNSNHQPSSGNVVNLFGNKLGFYPYISRTGQQVSVNGGLPQLANITAHLEKATSDILATIPDPDFDGIGVIDWEDWYPQWERIFVLYRNQSVAHVHNLHPDWDDATVTLVARLEWTQGAKLFMESTLKLAKQLRPKASWGFYHYPYCNNKNTVNNTCTSATVQSNDDVMWLFNESRALYPSIYLFPDIFNEQAYVAGKLSEAFRLRDKSSDPKGAVFSYTRFNYSDTGFYYNMEDLNNTILTSAEFGTSGVVFWGNAYDDHDARICSELRDYVADALGPTVVMARKGAMSCSMRVCSEHGRCVGNILTCAQNSNDKRSGIEKHNECETDDVCACRCFKGWQGSDCSVPSQY